MAERAFAPDTSELRAFLRHAEFTIAGLLPAVRHAELVSASIVETAVPVEKWTLKQVQGDGGRNG